MITIPAGKWFTGNLAISASASVAGTSTPTVNTLGTNAAPASGTVIGRVNVTGLALSTVTGNGSFEVIALAPPENDITIEFTAGATGTSSATINGFTF